MAFDFSALTPDTSDVFAGTGTGSGSLFNSSAPASGSNYPNSVGGIFGSLLNAASTAASTFINYDLSRRQIAAGQTASQNQAITSSANMFNMILLVAMVGLGGLLVWRFLK